MATLHELITKVIPLKGILRTPSYWMRKVLTAIADAVEAVQTELNSTSDKLALKDELLTKAILYAKTGQPFFVLKEGTKMMIDGKVIDAEPYTIYKARSLRFNRYNDFDATSVDFLISLNIPEISFLMCYKLTSLDVSNFDTSAVTDMGGMFSGCSSLTSLDLSNFNTSAVTQMNNMFRECSHVTSLDVSSFDTSKVTNMYGMFEICRVLTSLDLSNFDTSAVTDMTSMFGTCPTLTSLDLSSFNTSAVTKMGSMFNGCSSLTSLDVSNFDTSAVTQMNNMFGNCTALRNIKCKQAFKDWCVANASSIGLTVANITWEIVQ